jgi:hypothetical protein
MSDKLWKRDDIQFPRLLAEISANVNIHKKDWRDLENSMDLSTEQINEIFERAHVAWEKAKKEALDKKPTTRAYLADTLSTSSSYIEDGLLVGKVNIDMDEVLGLGLDAFLDSLSYGLTNTCLLSDIQYQVVGFMPHNVLVFEVKGDPAMVLDTGDCSPTITKLWEEWSKKNA